MKRNIRWKNLFFTDLIFENNLNEKQVLFVCSLLILYISKPALFIFVVVFYLWFLLRVELNKKIFLKNKLNRQIRRT